MMYPESLILEFNRSLIHATENQFDTRCRGVYSWVQSWGSTALGFGGMGGSAITQALTVVVITDQAHVYFGGRHAYDCRPNAKLMEAVKAGRMPSVSKKGELDDD